MVKRYTKEFLISELQRFVKENGRIPFARDMKGSDGYPSSCTYSTYFKTWNNALNAANLKLNKHTFNDDQLCEICGDISEYFNVRNDKILCEKCYRQSRNYLHGNLDPNSCLGIGIIAEHIVYKVLKDCEKCNIPEHFNASYDLISKKYGTINVKARALLTNNDENSYRWKYRINSTSKIPDNYICIGFNENRTEILHVWIIPKNAKIITKTNISITNSEFGLPRAKKYEVNIKPYNEAYQNLDIYTLPEFCNLPRGERK